MLYVGWHFGGFASQEDRVCGMQRLLREISLVNIPPQAALAA